MLKFWRSLLRVGEGTRAEAYVTARVVLEGVLVEAAEAKDAGVAPREGPDTARAVAADPVEGNGGARAPVHQHAMAAVARYEAGTYLGTAVVTKVEAAATGAMHAAALQAWRSAATIDHHTPLHDAALEVRSAHDDVDTSPPHALIPAPERQVQDRGILAGAKILDAEARKDEGALPAWRLHDSRATPSESKDVAVLRHPDALVVEARSHEHEAASGTLLGAGVCQEIDGAVNGRGLVRHDDHAAEAAEVPLRREVAATRRQDADKLGHGSPLEDE
mmetsp:Transcript_36797/g.114520  ORF Transcript_36797/g.114520 Transcript_36797/m.114520 type:complete len:276 (+) Transcript_36797:157-984(+)